MKNYKKAISANLIPSLFCLTSVSLITGCSDNTQQVQSVEKQIASETSVLTPEHNIDIWPENCANDSA